ncbi:transposase [Xenorhabdus indica]|nr:transposase [Xenorhabdus indica]MBC8945769.1 transposase [Xenorhabdus indica]
MSMPEPVIKRLDHLSLIAAFCHEIGLPRMIDAMIPKYSGHAVSHGDVFLARLLNGLGFHSRTLHMFSGFFKHKPLGRLIGPGIVFLNFNNIGWSQGCNRTTMNFWTYWGNYYANLRKQEK